MKNVVADFTWLSYLGAKDSWFYIIVLCIFVCVSYFGDF